jgi:hypothetical protein
MIYKVFPGINSYNDVFMAIKEAQSGDKFIVTDEISLQVLEQIRENVCPKKQITIELYHAKQE